MSPDIRDVLEGRKRWALVHGKCEDILPLLPAKSVAHVIADPPYSEHVHGKQRRMLRGAGAGETNKTRKAADGVSRGEVGFAPLGFNALSRETLELCASHFARLSRRWVLAFSDAESNHLWREELSRNGLDHVRFGAWVKENAQPQLTGDRPGVGFEAIQISHPKGRKKWNSGGHAGVWCHPIATDRNNTGERFHTTQKPLSLMLELISDFTDPDDIILDPFAGSATTGVAAIRLGRRFIGVEMQEQYVWPARERLAAEEQGLSVAAMRSGQFSLLGGAA